MNCFLLLLLLNAGVAGPTSANSQAHTRSPGAQLYYKALALERQGNSAGALELLENIVSRFPKDGFCDDAMAEIARLQDEELGQPAKALVTWKKVLTTFPHSRLARRAKSRVEFLQRHLDQGPEVLAEYERLLRQEARKEPAKTADKLKALLDANPDFSLRAQGLLFLAGLYEESGDADRGRQLLQEIVESFPNRREAGLALVRMGRLAMEEGRLDEAKAAFEKLKSLPDKQWSKAADDYLYRLSMLETGHWTLWLAMTILCLAVLSMLLGLVSLTRRSGWSEVFWPLPIELWVFWTTMIVLISVVWTRANQVAYALLWMFVMMSPLLVGNGLLLRKLRFSGLARVAWLLGGMVLFSLCVYVAISLSGMLGQVLHTLRFGMD